MNAEELQAFTQELLKLAGNLTQDEAMQRADQLRQAVGKRFNITPFLSGSMATGLNLPGKFDYDYGIRVKSRAKFDKLVARLERAPDIHPSPYNKAGTDYHVFSGKIQGEDVDLALMFGDKGKQVRDGLNRALKTVAAMPPAEKEKILKMKIAKGAGATPHRETTICFRVAEPLLNPKLSRIEQTRRFASEAARKKG